MGKSLVLAEKPSVARELSKILGCRQKADGCVVGERHIVTWALGHLVTLAEPEDYSKEYATWSLETLPMLPQKMRLVVIKETSRQYGIVQGLLKRPDVTDVIIATDAGREGELVARWILMKAGCGKPVRRLWISSQTEKAVREGFRNLKPGADYHNLFLSAQSRAEADWLVGLNVTRALACKHNAQLSAGRVQTPTLAMVVAREQEIRRFVPKDFYTVRADFGGFHAIWAGGDGQTRMSARADAEAVLARCAGRPGVVAEASKQRKHKAPPPAYDLTELQRDANRKYAYSAKDTLSIMQSLYERHKLLTYPRTDSRYITDDIVPTLPDRLRGVAVGSYKELAASLLRARPLSTRCLVDNAKVGDHHAIIPTEEPADLTALSPEERRVYDLVVRRFLATLCPAYEYEEAKLAIMVGKERFHAKGRTAIALGWKQAYGLGGAEGGSAGATGATWAMGAMGATGATGEAGDDDGDDEGAASDIKEQALPQIRQGDRLGAASCEIVAGKTKPPARFTEATLLTAMENPPADGRLDGELRAVLKATSGLGTPATRADIIEKLFASFYVERRGKEIAPTSKGTQLVSIAPADLTSAELTARWEQELALISKGQAKSDVFLERMRGFTKKLVSEVIASDAAYTHDNMTRDKCPDCGKYLLEVNGKKGTLLICPDRECGYRKNVAMLTNARCPNCHKKLEMRGDGEKRFFFCACGHREKLSDFEKRRAGAGASKSEVRSYLEAQERQGRWGGGDVAADAVGGAPVKSGARGAGGAPAKNSARGTGGAPVKSGARGTGGAPANNGARGAGGAPARSGSVGDAHLGVPPASGGGASAGQSALAAELAKWMESTRKS